MELVGSEYCIQNLPLKLVAEEFGTPVYVYDAEKIKQQFHKMRNAFGDLDVHIHYACKALTNINILKLLLKEGSELDCVSIQEVELGLLAGFKPEQILFTPNCVDIAEIQEAVKRGVHINIDNISTLEQFGNIYGNKVPCCIRLNPHIMAGGNKNISTGHIDSKFGISIHQLRHVMRVVETYKIHINGLHMHTGSDIYDAEVFITGAELIFETAKSFKELEFIDFGSGFKVAYKEGDITTDIDELGKRLSERFKAFCQDYGRSLQLWFEPGKYLVSEAGYLLVKANVIKQTTATVFVGVNSGQNHLLRPMFYEAYHTIINISNPGGTQRVYTVVGYICETDTLGWDRKLNEVRENDLLVLKNAGAYGYSMSSNYNSRLRPAEVLIENGKAKLIRKREVFDDLTRNMVMDA